MAEAAKSSKESMEIAKGSNKRKGEGKQRGKGKAGAESGKEREGPVYDGRNPCNYYMAGCCSRGETCTSGVHDYEYGRKFRNQWLNPLDPYRDFGPMECPETVAIRPPAPEKTEDNAAAAKSNPAAAKKLFFCLANLQKNKQYGRKDYLLYGSKILGFANLVADPVSAPQGRAPWQAYRDMMGLFEAHSSSSGSSLSSGHDKNNKQDTGIPVEQLISFRRGVQRNMELKIREEYRRKEAAKGAQTLENPRVAAEPSGSRPSTPCLEEFPALCLAGKPAPLARSRWKTQERGKEGGNVKTKSETDPQPCVPDPQPCSRGKAGSVDALSGLHDVDEPLRTFPEYILVLDLEGKYEITEFPVLVLRNVANNSHTGSKTIQHVTAAFAELDSRSGQNFKIAEKTLGFKQNTAGDIVEYSAEAV